MISEELLELIGMSDRIIAIKDGKLQAILNAPDLSENQIVRQLFKIYLN